MSQIRSFNVCFFDPPQVVNTNVTPIPGSGSAPLQVVADTGFQACVAIDFDDTTGDFIGVFQGPVGREILTCIIGNGRSGRSWGLFPAHSRISLRSMTATPITSGNVTGVLMSS